MRLALSPGACLLIAGSVGRLLAQVPVSIETDELRSHAQPSVVRDIPALPPGSIYQRVKIRITVDAAGHITSVDADPVYKLRPYWPEIEERIRIWQFRPFERNGNAVHVRADEYLRVVQQEESVAIRSDVPQLNTE